MALNAETVLTAVGGAGSASAIAMWAVKVWIKKVDDSLKALSADVVELKIAIAEFKGKEKGDSDLIWSKIDTGERKRVILESKIDRVWDVIAPLANPRILDIIKSALRDEK